MARTYLPTLLFILDKLCNYIAKYRNTILGVIGDANAAKLDAVVTACHALTEVIEAFIPD